MLRRRAVWVLVIATAVTVLGVWATHRPSPKPRPVRPFPQPEVTWIPPKPPLPEPPPKPVHARAPNLSGRVVDPDGHAVAGATISASPEWTSNARFAETDTRTESDGAFALDGIPSGVKVVLTVNAPTVHDRQTGLSAPAYPELAETLDTPARNVRIQFSPGLSLEGTVLDAGGRELPGVKILLESMGADRWGTRTDAHGIFHLAHLAVRRYHLIATRSPRGNGTLTDTVVQDVSLHADTPPSVTVQFPPWRPLRGTVADDRGRPVPHARLHVLASTDDPGSGRSEGPVETHADGSFEVSVPAHSRVAIDATDVPGFEDDSIVAFQGAGPAKLVLRHETFLSGRVLSRDHQPVERFRVNGVEFSDAGGRFRISSRRAHDEALRIDAEEYAETGVPIPPHDGKDLDLGDIVLNEGRTVVGRVFDGETKEPLRGAAVGWVLGCRRHPVSKRCTVTDSDGMFTLLRVPKTTHFLWAEREGFLKAAAALTDAPMYVELTLSRGATISGRVLTASGHAAANVEVRAESDSASGTATTDRAGHFRIGALTPGEYIVKTFADDGILPVRVSLSDHDATQIELRPPPPGARVLIHVVDEDGAPVDVTDAWAIPGEFARDINNGDAARRLRQTAFDAQAIGGDLVVQRLPPGEATIVVERGNMPYAVTADIPVQRHYELVIRVPEEFCDIGAGSDAPP